MFRMSRLKITLARTVVVVVVVVVTPIFHRISHLSPVLEISSATLRTLRNERVDRPIDRAFSKFRFVPRGKIYL